MVCHPEDFSAIRQFAVLFAIILGGMSLGVNGCAPQEAVRGPAAPGMVDEYALGKSLVNEVFSVYGNYQRDSFGGVVSRDFNPVRSEFVNGVERGFYGAQQISLYPIIDSVAANDDLLSVTFHWQKKVATYAGGNYKNLTGKAEYVFRNESGAWRLYRVSGEDPMTRN